MAESLIRLDRDVAWPGPELTQRQRNVLRAVVEDYVFTAVPVGSKALVSRYGLGVSPATVRSAMAELEALGLLSHPHTSAGRVPSDLGYRIYVESLMRESALDRADQLMIRHQFSQVQLTSNEWLRLAASILAASTRSAAVVTPARSRRAVRPHTARRAARSLPPRGPGAGRRQRRAATPRPRRPRAHRAGHAARPGPARRGGRHSLNAELHGLTAPQVRRRAPRLPALASRVAETVASLLDEADSVAVEEVFTDGIVNVLEQPEFAEGREAARRARGAAALRLPGAALVPVLTRRGGVHVIIGHENANDAMHEVSLVFAPYGAPDRALGLLGVLGPTRMPYPRAIPTVRYLSTLMNELINSHYGETQ